MRTPFVSLWLISYYYSRRIFRHLSLVWGYMGNVCFVQPLDPEVAVEVGGGFALAGMDVVLERILHVHSEQAPDCASGQLKKARNESQF